MAVPNVPTPDNSLIGWFVAVGGAIGTGAIAIWKWISANKLSQAGSNAQLDVINMLQSQLGTERSRADAMMKARDEALDVINSLKSTIALQTQQIEALTAQVQRLENTVRNATITSSPS